MQAQWYKTMSALVLSKYERVQVIAARVEQLLAGAPTVLSEAEASRATDIEDIAERELAKRVLPVRISRTLETGKRRIYDIRDFIDPDMQVMGSARV